MLATLAGVDMFQNRILGFFPNMNVPVFAGPMIAANSESQAVGRLGTPVQIADIYQAAKNRAIEDYELDKLFNPDYYDYQI
jgi:hypothetical protein